MNYREDILKYKLSRFPDDWKTNIGKVWNEMQMHYQARGLNMEGSGFDYSDRDNYKINVVIRKMGKSTLPGCTHCIVNRELARFTISINDIVYYDERQAPREEKLNTLLDAI